MVRGKQAPSFVHAAVGHNIKHKAYLNLVFPFQT
jgi:hypothetical protein